jgi:prepilin-type processing-associated H-X9-DG protein
MPVINPPNTDTRHGDQNAVNAINTWGVCMDYKDSAVDPSKAISTDNVFNGPGQIYHKNMKGGVAGINALFGDGHVRWQEAKQLPLLFNQNGIFGPSFDQSDERYLMYSWQP